MSVFLVQTDGGRVAGDYFSDVHKRLQSVDLVKNAFKGKVKSLGGGCFAVELRPVYSFFNLPRFAYKLFIKKGLSKSGYSGRVIFLSNKEAVMRLLGWDK